MRKTTQKLTLPAVLQKRPRDASSQSGSAASLKTPGETMPRPLPPLRPLPMAPVANCMGVLAKEQKMTPIRPLCHYFLQLGRNGLRKQTFATLTKPHGMIPIFPIKCVWCPHWRATARKTRSWFPQKHRMGLRYGVYLRTDLFSSKLSTYLRIFCHISSNISSTYSKFYPHVPHVLYYIYLLVCRWIFHTCTGYVPWI